MSPICKEKESEGEQHGAFQGNCKEAVFQAQCQGIVQCCDGRHLLQGTTVATEVASDLPVAAVCQYNGLLVNGDHSMAQDTST